MHIQKWSFLWTEYEYRRDPVPKTGTNFNGHLIQIYGVTFKYCLKSEFFETFEGAVHNLIATVEKKVDRIAIQSDLQQVLLELSKFSFF